MESVYDQFFYLKYSGGWSFIEAYNLPVGLRKWFMQRLITQLEREKEAMESGKGSGGDSQTLTPHNAPRRS
jgi:hypothetical protein|tara:strand:- start:63 stop:275 length:213 start_codon:yes stop_codon:yes gene_type:complete